MTQIPGCLGRTARIALGAIAVLIGPAGAANFGGGAAVAKLAGLTPAELVPILHAINQAEIEAGRKAEERGLSDAVRQYGATLVRDHQAADEDLKHLAAEENLDVNGKIPLRVEAALQHARNELANLSTVGGEAFDHEFASMMLADHQKAIQLVDRARPSVTDPKLKSLLGQIEPNLREHEQIASNILNEFLGASAQTPDPSGTASGPQRASGAAIPSRAPRE
jgi:putative membrane protein